MTILASSILDISRTLLRMVVTRSTHTDAYPMSDLTSLSWLSVGRTPRSARPSVLVVHSMCPTMAFRGLRSSWNR